GTRPRLERAAAERGRAGGLYSPGRDEDLLLTFHRAWPGDNADGSRADFQAADHDLGRLFLDLAAGDFVGSENRHDVLDSGPAGERFLRAVALFTDGRNDRPL